MPGLIPFQGEWHKIIICLEFCCGMEFSLVIDVAFYQNCFLKTCWHLHMFVTGTRIHGSPLTKQKFPVLLKKLVCIKLKGLLEWL